MKRADLIGKRVKIDGRTGEIVDTKYGPLLTNSSTMSFSRTVKLKVKPDKGRAFWTDAVSGVIEEPKPAQEQTTK